jgi:hypothetical protein
VSYEIPNRELSEQLILSLDVEPGRPCAALNVVHLMSDMVGTGACVLGDYIVRIFQQETHRKLGFSLMVLFSFRWGETLNQLTTLLARSTCFVFF